MVIKPKHKKFVAEYLKNGNNATQAYIVANPQVNYNTARSKGCTWVADSDIMAMLDVTSDREFVEAVAGKTHLIREAHEIKELAQKDEKYDTALRAVDLKAKLNNQYTDESSDSDKYSLIVQNMMINNTQINVDADDVSAEPVTIDADTSDE